MTEEESEDVIKNLKDVPTSAWHVLGLTVIIFISFASGVSGETIALSIATYFGLYVGLKSGYKKGKEKESNSD